MKPFVMMPLVEDTRHARVPSHAMAGGVDAVVMEDVAATMTDTTAGGAAIVNRHLPHAGAICLPVQTGITAETVLARLVQ